MSAVIDLYIPTLNSPSRSVVNPTLKLTPECRSMNVLRGKSAIALDEIKTFFGVLESKSDKQLQDQSRTLLEKKKINKTMIDKHG